MGDARRRVRGDNPKTLTVVSQVVAQHGEQLRGDLLVEHGVRFRRLSFAEQTEVTAWWGRRAFGADRWRAWCHPTVDIPRASFDELVDLERVLENVAAAGSPHRDEFKHVFHDLQVRLSNMRVEQSNSRPPGAGPVDLLQVDESEWSYG